MSFGGELRRRRLAAGLSLDEAARAAGMTKQGLSLWEQAAEIPRSVRFAQGLAVAYGVGLEELVNVDSRGGVGSRVGV